MTTEAENGTVTMLPGRGIYDSGTVLQIRAMPSYGFKFSGWDGLFVGADSAAVFEVTRSGKLKANFKADPLAVFTTLTLSPLPVHGKIKFNPSGSCSGEICKFIPGTLVSVSATADPGYALSGWTGGFQSKSKLDTTFVFKADSSLIVGATFDRGPVGLLWTSRASGTQSGLIGVTSGNGLIVAVGDSGTILTSSDGIGWIIRNGSPKYNIKSIEWNGKEYVAGGGKIIHSGFTQNTVMTSTDGKIWINQSGLSGIYFSPVWNGFMFLALGYDYNYSTVADYSRFILAHSMDVKSSRSAKVELC